MDKWILVTIGFLLISSLHTQIPYFTIVELYKQGAVIFAFICTLRFCRERQDIQRLCTVLVFLGAALSFFGLLQYVNGLPKFWWDKPYFLSSVYVNHNHFAGLIEIILPVGLGLVIYEKDLAKKILLIFLSGLMAAAFLLALSRGAFVSMTAAFIFMLVILTKKRIFRKSRWVFVILFTLAVCALIVFGIEPLIERIETVRGFEQSGEAMDRRLIWKGALSIIRHYFLWGSGPGTFGSVFFMFHPNGYHGFRPGFAHNDYLQLLSDCGIFSFLSVLSLFVFFSAKALTKILKEESLFKTTLGIGCLASLLALGIHSLIDFNFHIPANWLLTAVVGGILCSLNGKYSYYSSKLGRRIAATAILGLIIFLVVGSVFFGFSNYYQWRAKHILYFSEAPERAIRYLDKAVAINPFDPESYYLRGVAKEEMIIESHPLDELKIKEAINDFEMAIKYDSFNPYYEFKRAKLYGKLLKNNELEEVLPAYERALKKDSKDPKLYYLAGRQLLMFASKGGRRRFENQAMSYLKECLNIDSLYTVRVYNALWVYSKDMKTLERFSSMTSLGLRGLLDFIVAEDLWGYHRQFLLKSLKKVPPPGNFLLEHPSARLSFHLADFEPIAGQPVYAGSMFYRNGEIRKRISFPAGKCRLILTARSSPIHQVYGYLSIKLDGAVVDSIYIAGGESMKAYMRVLPSSAGDHWLSLAFINDRTSDTEDRNIWIDEIQLEFFNK